MGMNKQGRKYGAIRVAARSTNNPGGGQAVMTMLQKTFSYPNGNTTRLEKLGFNVSFVFEVNS